MKTQSPVQRKRSTSRMIREYLDKEFSRPDLEGGVKLPTIQALGKQLGVSTSTIYHVFRELRGEGRLRTKAGEGTYLIANNGTSRRDRLLIGISAPLPEVNDPVGIWGWTVMNAFQQATLANRSSVAIVPLPGVLDVEAGCRQLQEEVDFVDGMILVSGSIGLKGCLEIKGFYEEHGKPCIAIQPLSMIDTENFVSADFLGAMKRLGIAWWRGGRRRIALLAHSPITASVAAVQEFVGLQAGIESEGAKDILVEQISPASIHESSAVEVISRRLKSSQPFPDAIFCFGGPLAIGAIRTIRKAGLRVPEDVSIVSAMNYPALEQELGIELTCLKQPLEEIGRRALEMIIRRIERSSLSIPGEYLPIPFHLGGTTTAEENVQIGG